jgi:heme exporter protein A
MVAAAARSDSDPMTAAAIEVRGLRVDFGDRAALRGVDLTVAYGSRVALMGPNGAGKTTLLRVMAGLLRPTSGNVRIEDQAYAESGSNIRATLGVLGHQSYMYPELTVWENLRLFASLYQVPAWTSRAEDVLERVGLLDRRAERVEYLSRGMIQRLNLARAILHDPVVLLLDEPDAGLDAGALEALESILSGGFGSGGRPTDRPRTIVFTTHDVMCAGRLADLVVWLREGRIVDRRSAADLGGDSRPAREDGSVGAATVYPETRPAFGA